MTYVQDPLAKKEQGEARRRRAMEVFGDWCPQVRLHKRQGAGRGASTFENAVGRAVQNASAQVHSQKAPCLLDAGVVCMPNDSSWRYPVVCCPTLEPHRCAA